MTASASGTRTAVFAAVGLAGLLMASALAQTVDQQLAMARERLLQKYSDFKGYGMPPANVYATKLNADRKGVFDAVVRALFLVIDKNPPSGDRLINHVTAVTGIWGARTNDPEGRHMFRLSVRLDPNLARALAGAQNIGASTRGHVLMPVATGGDDDPAFAAFDVRKEGVKTYRQSDGHPSVQIGVEVAPDQ